ncbi:hypothetical protein RO3G_04412 [Rhizopus delemar RA 99-880]|uniref:Uncharacterized protein n=1 Tax=Rhizopus delemar (strain RA 99-880 / ATCC MYA-4621 / FGSC 9543 / NRRL 43880) TaxID=246409 RepID=I1BU27_RHIO9|nr:hypothetical protein RO3G_04412 [Rhizopus delemar RA 99-880]|eukprot:EIE79707.1 hypothetical protein RO3G_04412 [Rhizopus delemar RA 99-880]
MNTNQSFKRKNELSEDNSGKRLQIHGQLRDHTMTEATLPPRPTTPPLSMTLSHCNPSNGSYVSSQLNSNHEIENKQ